MDLHKLPVWAYSSSGKERQILEKTPKRFGDFKKLFEGCEFEYIDDFGYRRKINNDESYQKAKEGTNGQMHIFWSSQEVSKKKFEEEKVCCPWCLWEKIDFEQTCAICGDIKGDIITIIFEKKNML
jgi:hypothetical protein